MRKLFLLGISLAVCALLFLQPSGVVDAYSYDPTTMQAKTMASPFAIGSGWTVNHAFTGKDIKAAAKGKKGYIAVGNHGTMLVSQNGSNWTTLTPIGDYYFSVIASGGDHYVIFGQGNGGANSSSNGFHSTDGLTWTAIDFPQTVVYSLVWGKDKYAAVTAKGVFISKDGQQWELAHEAFGTRIEYINNQFIIFDIENSKMLASMDGVKWTPQSFSKNSYVEFGAFINGKYFAFSYNKMFTSTDLKTWTELKSGITDVSFVQIMPYRSGYLLFGMTWNEKTGREEMVAYHTVNGTTWTKQALNNFPYTKIVLFAQGNDLVGLGSAKEDGLYSISSSNGTSWTSKLVGVSESGNLAGIASNGKRTVAVGNFGAIVYTDNGINWHSANALGHQSISRPNFYDVTYGANKFVAYGSAGPYYSSDGISWTQSKLKLEYAYGSIEWTGTYFVATDQYHGIHTSSDGISWTKGKGIPNDSRPYSIVARDKQIIVAASEYNKGTTYTQLYQSTNGSSWSKLATLSAENVLLASNGKIFVAMDQYDTKTVWLSSDGKSWAKKAAKNSHKSSITSLQVIDGQFVATNNGYVENEKGYLANLNAVYVSKDGTNWRALSMPEVYPSTAVTLKDAFMHSIIKAYGGYFAVGEQGYLYKLDSLEEPIIIHIEGKPLITSADKGNAYIVDGTTYLPLRLIGEALGYEITWNPDTKSVTYSKGEQTQEFADVQLRNNLSYVPLRKVSESLGYKVGYEKQADAIFITINSEEE